MVQQCDQTLIVLRPSILEYAALKLNAFQLGFKQTMAIKNWLRVIINSVSIIIIIIIIIIANILCSCNASGTHIKSLPVQVPLSLKLTRKK